MNDRPHRSLQGDVRSDRQAVVLLGVLYSVLAALTGVWIALFLTLG